MYLLFLTRDNGDYAQNPNYEIKNLINHWLQFAGVCKNYAYDMIHQSVDSI